MCHHRLVFSLVSPSFSYSLWSLPLSRLSLSIASSPFSRLSFLVVSSCLVVFLDSSSLSFLPFICLCCLCCLPFSLVSLSLYSFLPLLVLIPWSSPISYGCRLGYLLLLAAAIEPLGSSSSIRGLLYPAKLPFNEADYCVAFYSRSFLIASYVGRLCVALFYLPLCRHNFTLVYSHLVFSVLR